MIFSKITTVMLLLGAAGSLANTNVHIGVGYETGIGHLNHSLHTYLGYEFIILEYTRSDNWGHLPLRSDGYGALLKLRGGGLLGGGVQAGRPYGKLGYKGEIAYVTTGVKYINTHKQTAFFNIGINWGLYSRGKHHKAVIKHKKIVDTFAHRDKALSRQLKESQNRESLFSKRYTASQETVSSQTLDIQRLTQEKLALIQEKAKIVRDYQYSLDSLSWYHQENLDSLVEEYKDSIYTVLVEGIREEITQKQDSLTRYYREKYLDTLASYQEKRLSKIVGGFSIHGITFGTPCEEIRDQYPVSFLSCRESSPEETATYTKGGFTYTLTISQKYGVVRIATEDFHREIDSYFMEDRVYTTVRRMLQKKYGGWWTALGNLKDYRHASICDQTLQGGKVKVSVRFIEKWGKGCAESVHEDDTKDVFVVYFSPDYGKHARWLEKLNSQYF
jgi:hypothetical protein